MIKVKINTKTGLHARPASLVVSEANKFKSELFLVHGDKKLNCKSIMAIMGSGLKQGDEVEIHAEGADAKAAELKLKSVIESIGDKGE